MIEVAVQPKVDAGSEENEAKPDGDADVEPSVTKVFDQAFYDMVREAWGNALTGANPPFTGKLEDPCYLKIVQAMRDFKPESYPEEEEKPAAE